MKKQLLSAVLAGILCIQGLSCTAYAKAKNTDKKSESSEECILIPEEAIDNLTEEKEIKKENPENKVGFVEENGKYKLFDGRGESVKNTWCRIGEKWFFFDKQGYLKTGWVKDQNNWYYVDRDDGMKTGWIQHKNNWYYLDETGIMKTGWFQDNKGNWYYFKSSGIMAVNETIDGYTLGNDGKRQ